LDPGRDHSTECPTYLDAPQARQAYAYAAGDPINFEDPDGRCSIQDGYSGCPLPASGSIDTSVVGLFVEPSWRTNHAYGVMCAAGALRVVLAFTSTNPGWKTAYEISGYYWPRAYYSIPYAKAADANAYARAYGWKYNSVAFGGTGDTTGAGYMMYLATAVKPTAGRMFGSRVHTWASGRRGVVCWDTAWSCIVPGSDPVAVAYVANWETNWQTNGTTSVAPYHFLPRAYNAGVTQFHKDIQRSIAYLRVPVAVSVRMSQVPSQYDRIRVSPSHTDGFHFISVVAYDPTYYYYVDTCWGYGSYYCGYSDVVANYPTYIGNPSSRFPGQFRYGMVNGLNYSRFEYRKDARYRYTWAIRKDQLYQAMVSVGSGGGWVVDVDYYSSRKYGW
jgi:hypothetical protein